jgi:hypothetical protein
MQLACRVKYHILLSPLVIGMRRELRRRTSATRSYRAIRSSQRPPTPNAADANPMSLIAAATSVT